VEDGDGTITTSARRVSLVVPTLNGGRRFVALLKALAQQDIEGGFEMVVIDSGSTDGTPEAAALAGAFVVRIDKREFNHGGTRNRAIERTRGEFIALLTQDAVPVADDYLTRLVACFEQTGADGVYARQTPRPDCDPLLKERLRRWSASRTEREVRCLAAGNPAEAKKAFDGMQPMDRYQACAFDNVASAVRRSAWMQTPLPLRSFGEDVAWARQILLGGGSIAFEPDAVVEHSHRIQMAREYARLKADHANLAELFGLVNVPDWGAVWAGWGHQRRFYRELLSGQELGPLQHAFWRMYAVPFALVETTAQFLGARSATR